MRSQNALNKGKHRVEHRRNEPRKEFFPLEHEYLASSIECL
jgi:hypothetical protein